MGAGMEYAAAPGAMTRLALALALLAAPACSEGKAMTVEALQREIETALPPGSAPETVAAWMNAHHPSSDGPLSADDLFAEKDRPGEYRMLAIQRDVKRSLFVRTAVQTVFTFDAERKLRSVSVRELQTGP